MNDADAHWTQHCFTQHLDPEKFAEEVKKSKMKKELKAQIEVLLSILFCNERIIHYRTSINYFLEKLIDQCPNCHKYEYRIINAEPKDGNTSFYECELICERCQRHNVSLVLPFKLVQSYCQFYEIKTPAEGEKFEDFKPRTV